MLRPPSGSVPSLSFSLFLSTVLYFFLRSSASPFVSRLRFLLPLLVVGCCVRLLRLASHFSILAPFLPASLWDAAFAFPFRLSLCLPSCLHSCLPSSLPQCAMLRPLFYGELVPFLSLFLSSSSLFSVGTSWYLDESCETWRGLL